MISVNIRKQGGAAVITILSDILKVMDVGVGASLQLDVHEGGFTARPTGLADNTRYSLVELLLGLGRRE